VCGYEVKPISTGIEFRVQSCTVRELSVLLIESHEAESSLLRIYF
jgi:hypothetical protein